MTKLSKKQIGLTVQNARTSLRALNPAGLAEAVEVLLADDNWREHLSPLDLQLHTWESFPQFVEEELETTGEALVKALRNYPKVAAMVADLLIRPAGIGTASTGRTGRTARPVSGTTGMRMRRLLRHRPDLAELVSSGQMTPTQATREAGWEETMLRVPAELNGFALHGVRRFGRDALLRAVQQSKEERRACVICGTEYVPGSTGRRQVTCGSDPCKKERASEIQRRRKKAAKEAQS